MQPLLAIASLTLKAAVRFKLVIVLAVVLLGVVVALPVVIKDDGTAQGLTQILMTYTLAITAGVLGFTTLWLACGSLARDIQDCQIQMVVVKPIARWKIWLGKWLGIMALNAALLALSGVAIYFLLVWRAQKLPEEQKSILADKIFVARGSAMEEPENLAQIAEQLMEERLKADPSLKEMDRSYLRQQFEEQVNAYRQVVQPGYQRRWNIYVGPPEMLMDQPMYLRVKFFTADAYDTKTYDAFWEIGPAEGAPRARMNNTISPESPIEFEIPPNLVDPNGVLTIDMANMNSKALLFPLEDGMEVLYREGTFGPNFARGLVIILCWLGFFAALGLMAASFLSFPVAAFLSLGLLIIGFSTGTLSQVIEEGGISGVDHETGRIAAPALIDQVAVPLSRGLLWVINLVKDFSPIDKLSTGRTITWGEIFSATSQIVVIMGGLFAVIGITVFTRRELATAQGT